MSLLFRLGKYEASNEYNQNPTRLPSGPYLTSDPETGRPETGVELVDNDEQLRIINYEIQDLFDSYYEFDSHNQACWFNEEQQRADKEKMLAMLSKLVARLEEINDGSFVVEDLETPRVQAL